MLVKSKKKEKDDLKKDIVLMRDFLDNTKKGERAINFQNQIKQHTLEIKALKEEIATRDKANKE